MIVHKLAFVVPKHPNIITSQTRKESVKLMAHPICIPQSTSKPPNWHRNDVGDIKAKLQL
jgi:hypothetical protein